MTGAEPPYADPFGPGPWSQKDVLAMPSDQRIELVGGALFVSSLGGHRHRWLALRVCDALNSACAHGRALGPGNVRLGAEHLVVADVVVSEDITRSSSVSDASAVLLIVEIVGAGPAHLDRAVKPELYADAAVPLYLQVEVDDEPVGHLHRLEGGRYREVAVGTVIELPEPCATTLDLAALDLPDDRADQSTS